MEWSEIATMLLGLGLGIGLLFGIASLPLFATDYFRWVGAHYNWKRVAQKYGLTFSGRFVLSGVWKIEGKLGEIALEGIATTTQTTIEAGTQLSFSVSIGPAARFSKATPTGDAELDEKVLLSATPLEISALDAAAREGLRFAVAAGVTGEGGRARFVKPARISNKENPLEPILSGLVTVARAFPIRTIADQIALTEDNAARDPSADFRRRCLLTLAEEPAAAAAYARAATNAASDSDPVLRSFHVIRDGSPESRLDLVKTLGPTQIEPLLLEAIARDARPEAEAILLGRLLEGNATLVPHLVRALAKVGGRDAVQPLRDATPGLLGSRELRSELTAAITAIQSRLENAGEGQLAIAGDDERGALSEAPKAGALSLPQRK